MVSPLLDHAASSDRRRVSKAGFELRAHDPQAPIRRNGRRSRGGSSRHGADTDSARALRRVGRRSLAVSSETRWCRDFPGAPVQVLATTPLASEQPIGIPSPPTARAATDTSRPVRPRTVRLVYPGTSTILPAESRLEFTVAATTQLRVDHSRLRNGQTVTFSGPVSTLPTPQGGKLIELQVRLPGRWETFQTIRTNESGQWQARYRFRRTGGIQYYRFRARLPVEGGYPFASGASRVVTVRVRGA